MRVSVSSFLVPLGIALPLHLVAAEEIALRVGEHPGHGRLVLEWSAPVEVEGITSDGTLTLDFSRRVDEVDFSSALEGLPEHLLGFAPGERLEEVVLQLAPGVLPHVWSTDRRTVIDLYRPELDPPLVPVRVGGENGARRLVFDWAGPVPFAIRQGDGMVAITFGAPGRLDPAAIAAGLDGLVKNARSHSGDTWSQLELDTAAPLGVSGRDLGAGRIQVDLVRR
jgi:hypothetical protein